MKFLKYLLLAVGVILGALILFIGGWIGYHSLGENVDISPAAYPFEKDLSAEEVEALARDLLSQMTLEEKVGQMSGEGWERLIAPTFIYGHPLPVYSGENKRLHIPPIAFTDGPRGVITAEATAFPVAMARAAAWDRDLERRVGDAIGKEARAAGANYFGGLCVNLLRHPSWGRAQECYGEDPWLMGEMGVALLEAVQRHNVMACAKHFALNSIENSRFQVNVEIDERPLRELYFPAFKKCVDAGVASIMSAYNRVRGEYCGHSRFLLTEVLREEWGFRGFVTSDWMFGLRDGLKGVRAGMDVEMPQAVHYGENLLRLVREGEVEESEIDEIVLRILRTKLEYVTREDPMVYEEALIASPAHIELSRRVAEESMVLLKNDGDLLPWNSDALNKVAVVGFLADKDNTGDHGSSRVHAPYVVTPVEGIREYLGGHVEVLHSEGSDLAEVRAVAAEADAVVVVAGFWHNEVGEYIDPEGLMPANASEKKAPFGIAGGDRFPLSLKSRDLDVIHAVAEENENFVVSLVSGSAVTMEEWRESAPAILASWFYGMEGARALPRILFGEVNPSGKLPFTWPRDESQLPPFDPYAREVEYGYYHGYMLFDKENREPAFPFGYGLSYTDFGLEALTVAEEEVARDGTLRVSVDVTNRGDREGSEVVQLYVGLHNSRVDRPIKILRDFAKVRLQPGETDTVSLEVAAEDLAWYNPEAGVWEVEAMEYEALVGFSAAPQDLLSVSFRVTEQAAPFRTGMITDFLMRLERWNVGTSARSNGIPDPRSAFRP